MEVERYETERGWWEVVRRRPAAPLRPFVGEWLEGWSQEDARMELREVPVPAVPLILNLGESWQVTGPGAGRADRLDSFVAGLHTAPALVEGERAASCAELRLTPLGARRLLGVPMHDLTNRTIALEEVLPGVAELTGRLRDTSAWSMRFDLIECFLARRLAASEPPTPGVAWTWQRLVGSGGRASIGALADELGWSSRRLISRFREQIGLAPKSAARVIRFDRAAARLRVGDAGPLAELALDCGYYDQAHLNRDFRELAGTTPTGFAAARQAGGGIAA
jgi:AraC-like DNA-binding protein